MLVYNLDLALCDKVKGLEITLKNRLMPFNGEYFQQIFGVIMGTNVAPIITHLHGKTGSVARRKM